MPRRGPPIRRELRRVPSFRSTSLRSRATSMLGACSAARNGFVSRPCRLTARFVTRCLASCARCKDGRSRAAADRRRRGSCITRPSRSPRGSTPPRARSHPRDRPRSDARRISTRRAQLRRGAVSRHGQSGDRDVASKLRTCAETRSVDAPLLDAGTRVLAAFADLRLRRRQRRALICSGRATGSVGCGTRYEKSPDRPK